MVNYYDILKVASDASKVEIKSAYRRLARQLHPDRNNGSEETALKFAAIAEAYEILGNAKERVRYDRRILEVTQSENGDSVFASANRHAKRWRQMVYEKRYNDIIDRMIAEERREAQAFQRVVHPAVALFVSTFLVMFFRPTLFASSEILGKIIIVCLFVVGVIHLVSRIREGLETYTDRDNDIHDSIFDESNRKHKPFSRIGALALLGVSLFVCALVGYLIGARFDFAAVSNPAMFSQTLKLEVLFYPPMIVFFVDLMHTIVSRFEN